MLFFTHQTLLLDFVFSLNLEHTFFYKGWTVVHHIYTFEQVIDSKTCLFMSNQSYQLFNIFLVLTFHKTDFFASVQPFEAEIMWCDTMTLNVNQPRKKSPTLPWVSQRRCLDSPYWSTNQETYEKGLPTWMVDTSERSVPLKGQLWNNGRREMKGNTLITEEALVIKLFSRYFLSIRGLWRSSRRSIVLSRENKYQSIRVWYT